MTLTAMAPITIKAWQFAPAYASPNHSALTNMSRLNHNYVICSQFGSIVFFMEIFCHIYNNLITDNPIMDISTSKRHNMPSSLLEKNGVTVPTNPLRISGIQFTKWKIFHFIFKIIVNYLIKSKYCFWRAVSSAVSLAVNSSISSAKLSRIRTIYRTSLSLPSHTL